MDKIISIIIPTYNMQEYLPKCLSSVIVGKEPGRVEAIVVNDGSTDSSLAIAREFENKHPDVFRIIDKPNGNYGSCVNAALTVATGKYIKLLDADDSFDTNIFETFVDMLGHIDTDLVLSDKMAVSPTGETLNELRYGSGRIFDFFAESDERMFISIMMHNVTYRRSIFDGIGYRQSEGIFYTDNEWIFMPMAYVRTAYRIDKPLYRYTIGREGQSVSDEVILAHIKDEVLLSIKLLRDFNKAEYGSEKARKLFFAKMYHHIRWLYKNIIVKHPELDSRILCELDEVMRIECPELYRLLGNKMLSTPMFCFKYISMWRKNPKNYLLKYLIKCYLTIK